MEEIGPDYREEAIKLLRSLRDEKSEEIPAEIVHFGDYKVRASWYTGIFATAENLFIEYPPVDPDDPKIKEVHANITYFLSPSFTVEQGEAGRIERTDSEMGNRTINLLLEIFA